MKYRIIGLLVCAVVALTSVVIQFRPTDKTERYHQHLQASEKAACTQHTEDVFCSHLPLVSIETGGVEIPGKVIQGRQDRFNENLVTTAADGEAMVSVKVSVYDNLTQNNHLSDAATFSTDSMIRVRGHASRLFEKEPYLLKFIDADGLDKDISVMGMDAHSEWVLNGPYLDKSLVRNYLFYNLAGEMMEYAPNVRYCEVFVDGDYKGIYLMAESVSNGDGCRLNLSITEKGQSVTGYLFRLDRISELDLDTTREIMPLSERTGYLSTDMMVRYPGKDNLTPTLAKQIETEISAFEKAISSYDYDAESYGYENYIDVDSAVDYFIINELTRNIDAGRYSTYIYKRPGDKYRFCVWDYNNSCDNFISNATSTAGFAMHLKVYFRSLCRDEDFTEAVIARYTALRKTILSDAYIEQYIDDTIRYLGAAIDRNNVRWRDYIASSPLMPAQRNVHTQKEAVAALKAWLFERGDWLDNNIDTLKQYSADSQIKKYNEVSD